VQAYVRHCGDLELYRLLDFYRCYRTYVRGKVTSFRLRDGPPPALLAPLRRQAANYFALAARYAACLTRPLLLLTTGLIGSGKSTVAQGLAAALDLRLYSSDRVRKQLAGLAPQTRQREAYGAGLYSAAVTRRTYDALADLARQALSRGHSVIIDASFAKRAERRRMLTLAQDMGADCCVLECVAPQAVLRQRLLAREQAPETISDAREEILAQFQRDSELVEAGEVACHVRLDTTQRVELCLQHALAAIQERRS
jgi:uncharacterized protein